jgi:hypothetical protein
MIQLDKATESFSITDRGRIAAKYYVQRGTIETFNEEMRPNMTEADVLRMLCMSNEVSATNIVEGAYSYHSLVVQANSNARNGRKGAKGTAQRRHGTMRRQGLCFYRLWVAVEYTHIALRVAQTQTLEKSTFCYKRIFPMLPSKILH